MHFTSLSRTGSEIFVLTRSLAQVQAPAPNLCKSHPPPSLAQAEPEPHLNLFHTRPLHSKPSDTGTPSRVPPLRTPPPCLPVMSTYVDPIGPASITAGVFICLHLNLDHLQHRSRDPSSAAEKTESSALTLRPVLPSRNGRYNRPPQLYVPAMPGLPARLLRPTQQVNRSRGHHTSVYSHFSASRVNDEVSGVSSMLTSVPGDNIRAAGPNSPLPKDSDTSGTMFALSSPRWTFEIQMPNVKSWRSTITYCKRMGKPWIPVPLRFISMLPPTEIWNTTSSIGKPSSHSGSKT